MFRHKNIKLDRILSSKNGFTVIEVLVAMTILTLFIMAFSALFVQSYTGIMKAGNKSTAAYDAQAEVEQRLAQKNADEVSEIKINFAGFEIDISGGGINVTKNKAGQSSSMKAFLAHISTMRLEPGTTDNKVYEDYDTGTLINAVGNGTNFVLGSSTLTVSDKNGFAVVGAGSITSVAANADGSGTSAVISLIAGKLPSSGSPYLFTITTGSGANIETVSAKLEVLPAIKYVCVGDLLSTSVSPNSSDWKVANWGPEITNFNSVIYCNGIEKFIAVGTNGKIMYSSNGRLWTSVDLNSNVPLTPTPTPIIEPTTDFKAITYGNSKTVAVGTGGMVYTSVENQLDYPSYRTHVNIPESVGIHPDLNAVTFGNGKFVTVGSGGFISYSSDGLAWSQTTESSALSSVNLRAVAYGPIFCGSTTGVQNIYAAAGDNGTIAFSKDGVKWYIGNVLDQNNVNVSYINFNGIAIANNKIVLTGEIADGDDAVFTIGEVDMQVSTADLSGNVEIKSVSAIGLKTPVGTSAKSIIYVNGYFWVIVNGNQIISSTDGLNWSSGHILGGASNMNSIAIR